jgi:hypothetical protein
MLKKSLDTAKAVSRDFLMGFCDYNAVTLVDMLPFVAFE